MKTQTPPTEGRDPLCWVVVNPEGKLLAILDSESEAYWFTRNRGHAEKAVYFKAPMDYVAAPELLEMCKSGMRVSLAAAEDCKPHFSQVRGESAEFDAWCDLADLFRSAISKATGGQP